MAIHKVCGIETEYGIVVRGAENNPVSASSLLINAYVAATTSRERGRVGWDFDDEQPANDARGFCLDDVVAPEIETTLVNAVLTNGARYYVDHAHPEISTPEVATALEAVRFDRAAEEIIRRSMVHASAKLAATAAGPAEVIVHKNNSDGKGNSYGCHENYLLAREIPFGRIVAQVTPHFVTRQVFIGAGKVGCELPGVPNDEVPYQLSQRADFFEEEVGLETTLKRPIVNTRDEPHCDAQKYRRLHVIVGDANMSEVATYLKVGTTAIVLAMIEDDALGEDWLLGQPGVGDPPGQPRPDADAHDHAARRPAGDGAGGPVGAARAGPQVRAAARAGVRRRGRRTRRPAALGAGAHRTRARPRLGRPLGRLGRQAPARRRLRRAPRDGARSADAEGDRPAVPRPASAQEPRRPSRPGDAGRSGRRRLGDHRAADEHAGVLPWALPRQVPRRDRGGELGLDRVRRRPRAAAASADDGAIAWNRRPRG